MKNLTETQMKFTFENTDVVELNYNEKQETEGGNPASAIAIGVAIYLIAEDWSNIKKGIRDAWNEQ